MSKILVVEDDRLLSEAYKNKLSGEGFEIRLAHSGQEALKEYLNFLPDVVVLDIKMPGSDGFFFLESLKADPSLKKVPIIAVSNSGDKSDIERAMALGATDYVLKSNLSMKGLIEKINELLHNTPPALNQVS